MQISSASRRIPAPRGRRAVHTWLLIPLGIAGTAAGVAAADSLVLTPLAADRVLHPPIEAALGPRGEVIALAAEGDARQLVLYRSDASATRWERWAALPLQAPGAVALAITPHAAVVVETAPVDTTHAGPGVIWVASVPLDAAAPADSSARFTRIDSAAPVLALTCDASPTLPDSVACAHLAFLTAAADTFPRLLLYCRTIDDGIHWSQAQVMARDSVDLPALFARGHSIGVVDLAYARAGFMRWRGGNRHGTRWGTESAVRLGVHNNPRSAIARASRRLFLLSESETHQIVGAPSRNGGTNWERAIALARGSDRPRSPALDWGGGRFWVAFAQGDSVVMARRAEDPTYPKLWSAPIEIARVRALDGPAVVALPDSTALILFAAPEGRVWSARVR